MRLIILLIVLTACDNNIERNQGVWIEKDKVLKNNIIGKWGGIDQNKPVWEITKDSFYFKETSTVAPYDIVENDVIIYKPEFTLVMLNVRIIGDTLLFHDKMGDMEVRAFRVKYNSSSVTDL